MSIHFCSQVKRSTGGYRVAGVLAAAVLGVASRGMADTWSWTGFDNVIEGNNNWSATTGGFTNWNHTVVNQASPVPVSNADTIVNFAGEQASPANEDIANPFTLNSVIFDASSLNGSTLQGGTLNLVDNSSNIEPSILQNSPVNEEIDETLTLGNDTTFGGSGAGLLKIGGSIGGTGALTTTGSSALVLSTNNSYSGGTTFGSGTVEINSGSSLGTGPLTLIGGGLLSFNPLGATVTNVFDETPAGGSFNLSAITGTKLTLSTSGELFYTNFNLSIGSPGNAGTVHLNMSNAEFGNGDSFNAGIVAVNDGTLDVDGIFSQTTSRYQESIAAGATLNYNSFSSTVLELTGAGTAQLGTDPAMTLTLDSAEFTGVITGSGNLVLGSAVVLTGKNTYSGSTTFNGGLVGAGNASAFSSGAVTVAGATTLFASGADQTIANPITINSGQTLTIGVDPTTTHTLTLTLTGAITNGGSAAINAASGAILEYGAGESLVGFVLGGTGTQMLSDETSLVGVTVNNGLTIMQNGSTTVTNFTNGGTFVNNSVLTWNGGINGVSGVLNINATAFVNAFSSYGTIDIALSGTLTNTATNLFLAGGSLMQIGSPSAPGGNLEFESGRTLEVNGASLINDGTILGTTDVNFGGVAQGNGVYGPINIASGGAFTPGSSGTAHGTTGAVVNNGVFNMLTGTESIASITGAGMLALSGGAKLAIDANSGKNSVGSLSIDVAHGSQLDLNNGALFINYGVGADPIASIASYIKSGYASAAWTGPGIMSTTDQTATAYGIGYADGADGVVNGLSSGQIEIRYTLYGDANLDGVVNGVDFTILAGHLGKVVSGWDQGDFNYDGVVNGQDFTALIGNLGKAANGGSVVLPAADYAAIDAFAEANGLMADVPEPGCDAILLMAIAGAIGRRSRRHVL